jgi:type IV secretion system protein VirD4
VTLARAREGRPGRAAPARPLGARPLASIGVGAVAVALAVWAAGELGALATAGTWPRTAPSWAGSIALRLALHPCAPAMAWPAPERHLIPGAPAYYVLLFVLLAAPALCAIGAMRRARRPSPLPRRPGAAWATARELEPLVVGGPGSGRLILGRSRRRLLAAEPRQSVIVVGPTQTHKTTGFAVPAILEWEGPVLATSVKSDLVRDTLAARQRRGTVWTYDPTGATGLRSDGWSPLRGSETWPGARRMAAALCSTARSGGEGLAEGDFWYSTAAKLLAPLLFAASRSGRTIADVVGWVDTQEMREVASILVSLGVPEARRAAEATWARDERQLSSVYTTAETVLEAFADPAVSRSAAEPVIGPDALLRGGQDTLYVCAPAHEQARLRSAFVALVTEVLAGAYLKVSAEGKPLDPPMLVVLDEAANVAPLADLDALASTAAGHGLQLVTIWQDMAQISARYGARAATVVNNHRAKVVLSGISDPATLEHVSALVGEQELTVSSTTRDRSGGFSTTQSSSTRRLAPADALRRILPGYGVLVYGHLPPAHLELRPWYRDGDLAAAVEGHPPGGRCSSRLRWGRRARRQPPRP